MLGNHYYFCIGVFKNKKAKKILRTAIELYELAENICKEGISRLIPLFLWKEVNNLKKIEQEKKKMSYVGATKEILINARFKQDIQSFSIIYYSTKLSTIK